MSAPDRGETFYASRGAFERRASSLALVLVSQFVAVCVPLGAFVLARQPIGVAIFAPVLVCLLLLYGGYWLQVQRMEVEATESYIYWYNGLGRKVRLRRASVASVRWIERLGLRAAASSTALQLLDGQGRTLLALDTSRWDIEDLQDLRDLLDVPVDVVANKFSVGVAHRPGELRWGLTYTLAVLLVMAAASSTALFVHERPPLSLNPNYGPVSPTYSPT